MSKIFKIIILLLPLTNITACNNNYNSNNYKPTQQEVSKQQIFYKTIDVKIIDIQQTWKANNLCKWTITVKSEEYNLEDSFEESTSPSYSSLYGIDLYQGKLKTGDIIKAKMYTWKTGDRIDKRSIMSLEK